MNPIGQKIKEIRKDKGIKDGHLQVVSQSSHIGYYYQGGDVKHDHTELLAEKDKRIEEKDVTIKLLFSEIEKLKEELSKFTFQK